MSNFYFFLIIGLYSLINDNNFKFEVIECIDTKDKERNEENINKISSQISSFYQKMITKYPEQYFWFHNRWKI